MHLYLINIDLWFDDQTSCQRTVSANTTLSLIFITDQRLAFAFDEQGCSYIW